MRASNFIVPGLALMALACGGGGSPPSEGTVAAAPVAAPVAAPAAAKPMYGSVAFQTYDCDGDHLKFKNDTKVVDTWDAMSGDPMTGGYTQGETDIVVDFDPAKNSTMTQMKFRQLDDCSIALYESTIDGVVSEESSVYRRSEPRCPHR